MKKITIKSRTKENKTFRIHNQCCLGPDYPVRLGESLVIAMYLCQKLNESIGLVPHGIWLILELRGDITIELHDREKELAVFTVDFRSESIRAKFATSFAKTSGASESWVHFTDLNGLVRFVSGLVLETIDSETMTATH